MSESDAASRGTLDADVLVFGGGFAGLTAALAALETGARVVLLEKGDELGGSFLLGGGAIWTWSNDGHGHAPMPLADARLLDLLGERLAGDIEWLEGHGVTVIARQPGRIFAKVDPHVTVTVLEEAIRARGGTIVTRAALGDVALAPLATSIVHRDGARRDHVAPRAMVLATGGFQGSAEMVARYVGVSPDSLLLRANPWSTGDALRAVLACGGAITSGLDDFYGAALPDVDAPIPPDSFRGLTQYWAGLGVALNLRGERFTDESEGGFHGYYRLNRALAHEPSGVGFCIIDHEQAAAARMPDGSSGLDAIERARAVGARIIDATTLDELCERLDREEGVPYATARASLDAYQRYVLGESEWTPYPPRRDARIPLATPPFHALRMRAAITMTAGGIAVDRDMRVLAQSGAPASVTHAAPQDSSVAVLPGLYVAGADVGNVSHGGYVGGLSAALVFGRVAGTNAAAFATRGVLPNISA